MKCIAAFGGFEKPSVVGNDKKKPGYKIIENMLRKCCAQNQEGAGKKMRPTVLAAFEEVMVF